MKPHECPWDLLVCASLCMYVCTRVHVGLGKCVCINICVCVCVCLNQLWQELGKPLGAAPIVPSVDSFVDSVMVRGASVAILTPAQPSGRQTHTHTLRENNTK